jgi:hypothetical protein
MLIVKKKKEEKRKRKFTPKKPFNTIIFLKKNRWINTD